MPDTISYDPDLLRSYSLTAFDVGVGAESEEDEGVELNVQLPSNPDIRKHVSLAGLYLVAIMSLDQDGTIANRMDELMQRGAINEVDACNFIQTAIDTDTTA